MTALCRNGENFGVRIAVWRRMVYCTGKYASRFIFTGYSADDANTDIGDSAITETIGVGGMAMIAAPAVTRFVGTGGFDDA